MGRGYIECDPDAEDILENVVHHASVETTVPFELVVLEECLRNVMHKVRTLPMSVDHKCRCIVSTRARNSTITSMRQA